ncbi:glutamate/tyrosine decarboxylase-like PLP-dependent enzyme [Cryobacterium mesophilum]|uniref:Aspartate aminotransferase family protein n=1 Tax=Terrimesophilobacter mesophilus TaxID=433647 RepID=A0A4R8VED5_9MICO|nr:aspartate aminotransferase family protein [Terrimesophilobacter mesophilus]MBB5633844.1 glutamate/tyrosine decarboxylase-like PLP-dependent enzyme [Terrimesophilobacter mesophilus]TFB80522.1 aspartate aminotransferase family protein [Terrimesophilobacter mesophilus]
MRFQEQPADILARLQALRDADAPTHGGRVLSYVYDSGLAELDELAATAIRMVQPVNGLDPTTFTSVATMEREVLQFARQVLHGDEDVVGSVTSGGTESCLLAVKTARDDWRAAHPAGGMPRLLAPSTAHAAFQKAAHYFGLELDLVPVGADGTCDASAIIERLGEDVALVVVSAPSYPFAALDPVAEVASASSARGIACHVDACIGGFVLPWLEGVSPWDFRVPGVTSLSADLHKFGYAPKGASVLLQRGRDRQRAQYFATTRWPGYPVVNPTMLGSKSAGALAASWAITRVLGEDGYAELAAACDRATVALRALISGIEGLRVVGDPVGPLFAVATDESVPGARRVDPHHWADRVRGEGFLLQLQPAFTQADGSRLPSTTHFTITPVTETVMAELSAALVSAADAVRGVPPVSVADVLAAVPDGAAAMLQGPDATSLDSETAAALLAGFGLGRGADDSAALPERMAPILALVEALPAPVTERLLIELLARLVEPRG